ncbi:MAG: hypothetical protein AAF502_22875 [Bacteroidota bacterium]
MNKNGLNQKKEAEKTLGILDNLKRVESDPLLFEKIQGRLDTGTSDKQATIVPMTLLKYAAAILLFVMNAYLVLPQFSDNSTAAQDDYIQELANDYALTYDTDAGYEFN